MTKPSSESKTAKRIWKRADLRSVTASTADIQVSASSGSTTQELHSEALRTRRASGPPRSLPTRLPWGGPGHLPSLAGAPAAPSPPTGKTSPHPARLPPLLGSGLCQQYPQLEARRAAGDLGRGPTRLGAVRAGARGPWKMQVPDRPGGPRRETRTLQGGVSWGRKGLLPGPPAPARGPGPGLQEDATGEASGQASER